MPVDAKLLEILCCPVSHTPLVRLSGEDLAKLNAVVAAGDLRRTGGEQVTEPLQEALVTEDRKVIYPVRDGIPILLEDEAIGTTQLKDFQACPR